LWITIGGGLRFVEIGGEGAKRPLCGKYNFVAGSAFACWRSQRYVSRETTAAKYRRRQKSLQLKLYFPYNCDFGDGCYAFLQKIWQSN